MKNFEDILKMTQPELKAYLKRYLISKKYEVVDGDGYLYAKGTVPVLLVAHTDRHPCQAERVKKIKKENRIIGKDVTIGEVWSSPEGICGDDRCGVWTIMNVVNNTHCSVLFCEDEETGSVGAGKFCQTNYIKHLDVNYMVQIDRHGSHDLVFYSNDNREFVKWLEEHTDFKEQDGSFTDICKLMPASGIAGVNFSCGYYIEHKKEEYIVMDELKHTMETIQKLVTVKVDKPFKYVEKQYPKPKVNWYNDWQTYDRKTVDFSPYGNVAYAKQKTKRKTYGLNGTMFDDDSLEELTLTIQTYDEKEDVDDTIIVTGRTKHECWFRAFSQEPWLCFDMITGFAFE